MRANPLELITVEELPLDLTAGVKLGKGIGEKVVEGKFDMTTREGESFSDELRLTTMEGEDLEEWLSIVVSVVEVVFSGKISTGMSLRCVGEVSFTPVTSPAAMIEKLNVMENKTRMENMKFIEDLFLFGWRDRKKLVTDELDGEAIEEEDGEAIGKVEEKE